MAQLYISTNIQGLSARRYMDNNAMTLGKAQENLASGKITSDLSNAPSEAAMGNVLGGQISILGQATRSGTQAEALIQVASGVLGSSNEILIRMKVLAVQANNGSLSNDERHLLNVEYRALEKQLNLNADTVWGRNTVLLRGNPSALSFQISVNADDMLIIPLLDASSEGLELESTNIDTVESARDAIHSLESALNVLEAGIASLGASKSRLSYHLQNLAKSVQNQSVAKATFTDSDIAEELMNTQTYKALLDMSAAVFRQSFEKSAQLADIVQAVVQ